MSIPVAAGFKALVAGIAGLNPAGSIDVPPGSAMFCQVEVSATDRSLV
jgi:hypothetical protein